MICSSEFLLEICEHEQMIHLMSHKLLTEIAD